MGLQMLLLVVLLVSGLGQGRGQQEKALGLVASTGGDGWLAGRSILVPVLVTCSLQSMQCIMLRGHSHMTSATRGGGGVGKC